MFQFYPWTRVAFLTEQANVQASFYWLKTVERLKKYTFDDVHVQEGITAVFYIKSKFSQGIEFTGYEALKDLDIVEGRSYWYEMNSEKSVKMMSIM